MARFRGDHIEVIKNTHCHQCKKFVVIWPYTWVYARLIGVKRNRKVYFCSYSCMKAFDDAHPPKVMSKIKWQDMPD